EGWDTAGCWASQQQPGPRPPAGRPRVGPAAELFRRTAPGLGAHDLRPGDCLNGSMVRVHGPDRHGRCIAGIRRALLALGAAACGPVLAAPPGVIIDPGGAPPKGLQAITDAVRAITRPTSDQGVRATAA